MDIGKERKEIIVVPLGEPQSEPAPTPAEPAKEPVGV